MSDHVTPTDERLERTAALGATDDTPVVMLNLNRYRDRAQYPAGTPDADVSGREAYLRYGVVAFAFGLGGVQGLGGGLLHLTVASLVLPVLCHGLERAAGLTGSGRIEGIRGLLASHRGVGVIVAGSLMALAVLPPFGLFGSTVLILGETARTQPWLVLPLGIGLVAGAGALSARLVGLCLGPAMPDRGAAPGLADLAPAWLLLGLAVGLGMAPPALAWFTAIVAGLR